jgi:hypothetical protein
VAAELGEFFIVAAGGEGQDRTQRA